jgi:diguanylate cyclase (GGDEF)-like protein/PAS domain S-box-containing protein
MKPGKPPLLLGDANEEVAALIQSLHETGQRLEELTAGEVDTVADRDGHTFLLGRAQEQLRHSEAAKQAAILNALPAHIALLDTQGIIVAVNEAWRRFGSAHAIQGPGYKNGLNYLEICDSARGDGSSEAHQVARGIRSVLGGRVKSFSIEYPCRSPTEQRWFLLTVTPLADGRPNGAVVMHLDITERRRTQVALAQSEDGLHRAQLVAKLAHVITGPDGSFEQWSETLPRLVGVEPAQLPRTTRAWLDIVHPDDQTLFRETTVEASVKKLRVELEYRLQRADGEWINVRQTMEPIKTVATGGSRWFNTLQDVTAQRRTEESLRASESRFRQMADHIRDVFFLVDAETNRTLYLSPAFEEIWGRTRDSVYAKPDAWTDAIHPADRASTNEKYKKGMSAGNFEYEYRIVRPDGSIRWIEARGFPIRDAAGKIVRITGVAKDITERKQSAEELRESERRFSDVLGNVEMVSLMLDTNARITYCNDYLLRLTGWRREEVMGRDWFELFIPPEINFVKDIFASILANLPEARHHENWILTRSGERRLIRWNNSVLRSGAGDVVGTASIGEDITEQKRAEIRIKRLNRVYAVLSGINTLIVRVRDRGELFREACRIAVQAGQFPLAWVALADPLDQRVKAVAWAGDERGFVQLTRPTVDAKRQGKAGLSAQAMEKGIPVVCNDIEADGGAMRYPKEALERGYRSAAALPLVVEGTAIGALVLYAAEAGFFDDEETKLLVELAGDISFALDHIEKEEKVRRLTRVHAVLTGINAAIVRIRDRKELFRESCRIACEAGQLRLAWIGIVDPRREEVVPAAFSGAEQGLLGIIQLSTREDSGRFGMAGRAIRDRAPAVSHDLLADKRIRYSKEQEERGFRSLAMIPLIVHGSAIGVLGLHVAEAGFFNQDEMKLLMEVAGNIAFALEHIQKEEKVRQLTRTYAVLSGINTLIVRARDRDELFKEACRVAVDAGAFTMAWIGIVDGEAGLVKPVASAGDVRDFFESAPLAVIENKPGGHGLAGRAVRDKKPMISNDVPNDPQRMMRKKMEERGINSLAVMPLIVGGEAIGVFALYSADAGFFDDEEMRLLQELAGDIAFAIDHIDKQERLDYLAYYDVLTGLANRRLFVERVAQYMRSAVSGGHQLALFLVDLERFKGINDSLGRPAGDALLTQVAQWLTRNVGDANLLARVGADHFAVVLPEVKQAGDVVQLVENTLEAFLQHPFRLNDSVFRIAFKAGGALFPDDGASADTLFKNAEAALKKAKASGDRYLFYTQKMTETVAGKLTLENQLRQALDKGEFELHYQPKVNLVSGKLTSAEALIRWNDPLTGLVPPGRFIPILEETGLIHGVGRWALRKAVEDYLRWRTAGLAAVRIAVNVSPLQLRSRGFVAEIKHVIGMDAHAAAGLELEITESMIMEDVKNSIATLKAIRAMGVSIAIDDFGTGFSSLSYLSKLPVDTLKIDRSFVIDMAVGPEGLALVSAIITLAHSLKLNVVAEGVETEEQSRLLRLLDCDEYQGFLFSKPVPSELFEARYLAPTPAVQSPAMV